MKNKALLLSSAQTEHPRLRDNLRAYGYSVLVANNLDDAIAAVVGEAPQLLVLDLDIAEMTFKLLRHNGVPAITDILLIGADTNPEAVAKAMRLGADDYIDAAATKAELASVLDRINADPTDPLENSDVPRCGALIGGSQAMRRVYRMIRKVAPTPMSVLLIGESGTGKELAAHAIHNLSEVADGPYVAINCGAISSELMESELFGHEKGSFTGAISQHKGHFEAADGGTLFLDEITEMDIELQVKLLRVLEVGTFRRVGGRTEMVANVRLIAASNRPPAEAIEDNKLRQDLYYRLAQFPIQIPPLREREDDIMLLAGEFLQQCNQKFSENIVFSKSACEHLRVHTWPGNVRELRNAVSRAHILADQQIEPEDFPSPLTEPNEPLGDFLRVSVGSTLRDVERRLIMATLKHQDGDKKATADILGISLKTLYNRLSEYKAA